MVINGTHCTGCSKELTEDKTLIHDEKLEPSFYLCLKCRRNSDDVELNDDGIWHERIVVY